MANDSGRGRAFDFLANGGGLVLSRLAVLSVPLLLGVIGYIGAASWQDLKDGQSKTLDAVVRLQGQSIVNSTQIDGIKSGQRAAWDRFNADEAKIADHEHRISLIEGARAH
jgi:hypothetical protein